MTIIRISLLVQVDSDEDVEDIRSELLDAVKHEIKNNPNQFSLRELNEDDEEDWEEIEFHDGYTDWEIDSVHPSFDPVLRNET
jgi:hypothetical protein